MKISIIVAADEKGCIGNKNLLPWADQPFKKHDMRWFKELTVGHVLIMGRKTFESCGPLQDRYILVMSKKPDAALKKLERSSPPHRNGVEIITNPEHPDFAMTYAITRAKVVSHSRIFICGGSEIYKQGLEFADEVILTKIPGTYEGDTHFPVWPLEDNGWSPSCSYRTQGLDNELEFVYYNRIANLQEEI